MKELMSITERRFILAALAERRRIDGREAFDYREVSIEFGADRGCCYVQIGNTKVLAQVSCNVTSPKESRPMDGLLVSNVEFSPMAGPQFEANRPASTEAVETSRLVERCLKESRCVDTESLCIMAGTKVWCVRVDVRVLAHCGNVVDAASIAAIAGLLHFRRPDVTVCGTDVTVHPTDERDPIPLSIHHIPICVTFAFFEKGKYQLVDPTHREEGVMDGKMVVAMNKHREICMLQVTGGMLLLREQVTRCTNMAATKVVVTTELIQRALERDAELRRVRSSSVSLRFGLKPPQTINVISQEKITPGSELGESSQGGDGLSGVRSATVSEVLGSSKDTSIDSDIEMINENSDATAPVMYVDSSDKSSEISSSADDKDVDDDDEDSGDESDEEDNDDDDSSVQFVSPYIDANKTKASKKKVVTSHRVAATGPNPKQKVSSTMGSKKPPKGKALVREKMQTDSSVIEVSESSEDDDEEEDVVIVKSDDFGFKRKK